MTTAATEIFDASAYDLPIPRLDGHKADKLILAFGGQIELDRTDSEDLDLIARLELGHDVDLQVTAAVAGKGFAHRASDDDEQTTYRVALRVHTLNR